MSASAEGTETVLVNSVEAAKLLGIKRTHWYTLKMTGKLPVAVKLGRRDFWIRDEILRWVAAGCPSQSKWEQIKASGKMKNH
ncbi:MAG: helix-turn-helix domain-containing protein [Planctomycetota bacterium]|jgi:predicted DNA-binding transcriptional regulator AlpA|nr:helix-turn-helix domain-containing protein [Planctomycetota bacterium]